jgi:glycerophosphoryl diester phosphodiesterase
MSEHPVLLYGHRGAAAERPENTAPSFELALSLGVDAIETDVHLTRDGVVVVAHDDDGRRMAHVPRDIAHSTLEQVRGWDIGWGFVDAQGERPFAGRGIQMMTLEELCALAPGVRLNLDLKSQDPRLVDKVIRLLDDRGMAERAVLASFHADVLRRVRSSGWRGRTGLAKNELGYLAFAPRLLLERTGVPGNAAQVPLGYRGIRFDNRAFIEKCHALGLRVDYWTINDPAIARRLLDLGADGVMTDDPRAIAPVFENRRNR